MYSSVSLEVKSSLCVHVLQELACPHPPSPCAPLSSLANLLAPVVPWTDNAYFTAFAVPPSWCKTLS